MLNPDNKLNLPERELEHGWKLTFASYSLERVRVDLVTNRGATVFSQQVEPAALRHFLALDVKEGDDDLSDIDIRDAEAANELEKALRAERRSRGKNARVPEVELTDFYDLVVELYNNLQFG